MESKQCTTCKELKPLKEFYKNKHGKFGVDAKCKSCAKVDSKKHFQKNRKRYNELWYDWYNSLTPGVYFIKANNGTYVGESQRIEFRVTHHKRKTNKESPVDKVLSYEILEVVKDTNLRKEREEYWIKKLNPNLNKKI